mmetsp:Transcript_25930/g.50740  ORF Transcript_25930/g.50740 Transcript_25930/m.50740 type:complete len:288 (-) Transcript_25930:314-1177(-)|eukprot:CAMPEP_0167795500 /NCGR_PEP_ID=MMETSP0111_2-20121227/14479_1 /TAXON_ID=91324 /ORGANISM="Lotharella globosa, Strain CCCM811" /LENGTH=287 /DNA_ID=CAMNT_0007689193 /DNA_START=36 /DNA_END=899 /DNA_ORIENTATION=+
MEEAKTNVVNNDSSIQMKAMSTIDGSYDGIPVAGGVVKFSKTVTLLLKFGAEFLGMMFFVIVGCGTAVSTSNTTDFNASSWILTVAFAFGIGITTLAYTIGHFTGAHINCAVTFGLVLAGACPIIDALVIFAGQIIGSIVGAAVLAGIFNKSNDGTGALGSNQVSPNFGQGSAFLAEAFMTAMLMFVVNETAIRKRLDYMPHNKLTGVGFNAPIAIGFAVFLAHLVLIPVDGCSINPTRSFGPLVIASARGLPDGSNHWEDFWIFVVAPLTGAGVAGLFQRLTTFSV